MALAASAAVALPCAYMSESETASTSGGMEVVTRSCRSLLEHSTGAVLFYAGPPLLLTFIGVLAALLGERRVPLIAGALIVCGSLVITVFTFAQFPLYFAPAGACLVAAGTLGSREP